MQFLIMSVLFLRNISSGKIASHLSKYIILADESASHLGT